MILSFNDESLVNVNYLVIVYTQSTFNRHSTEFIALNTLSYPLKHVCKLSVVIDYFSHSLIGVLWVSDAVIKMA
jgi:hypothetical protein